MRSIVVLGDRDEAMGPRLDTALSLARAVGGHISLAISTPVSRYVAMDPLGGSYVAEETLRRTVDMDDALAKDLAIRLGRGDVPFDVVRSEDEPANTLSNAARLADLLVVSRGNGLAGQLAIDTNTPVLVVPNDEMLQFPIERACIAWDGGNESANALRASVDVLKQCQHVELLTITEKTGGFAPTEALAYLSRHGIHAEFVERPRVGSTVDSLADAVAKSGAQLLVMGAYGKSRMRELLFGGVTQYFLEKSTRPALLMTN